MTTMSRAPQPLLRLDLRAVSGEPFDDRPRDPARAARHHRALAGQHSRPRLSITHVRQG